MLRYSATIFLSAFLLFQIQPLIAKQILPWFGGAASVWIVCLVFFQLTLLAGYVYADVLVRIARPRLIAAVHVALLALSLAWMPVIADPAWKPLDGAHPVIRIVGLLVATIGLPYLMLSTTAPLVQAWFARRYEHAPPYRLYAVANLAALLGLAAYPFVVEPALATDSQARVWSFVYAAFAVLCAVTAFHRGGAESAGDPAGRDRPAAGPTTGDKIRYLVFSAVPAALLLAVTNYLTESVASTPFLWVVPLCLYLLSFVLCFGFEAACQRAIYLRLQAIALVAMAYFLWEPRLAENFPLAVGVYSGGLFIACMFCHGELARRKPHPRYLTGFYLMVALGGALGGLFVSVAAPHLFQGYFELGGLMLVLALLTMGVVRRGNWRTRLLWGTVSLFLAATLVAHVRSFVSGSLAMGRNFYGSLRVTEFPSTVAGETVRTMVHGITDHGREFLSPRMRDLPTSYYGRASGIGLLLGSLPDTPARVAIIGLGTGTLATYGRSGDYYRFYEVNPLVADFAGEYFHFLDDSAATIDIVLGDGRLSLEREEALSFDVLVVDAFSGGSIPFHMLTREAFELFLDRLNPGGVLALHVTDPALDLTSVVAASARSWGAGGLVITNPGSPELETSHSIWALVARDPGALERPELHGRGQPLVARTDLRTWTDDYSNLFAILR
jgi:hypothetical protein